MRDERSLAALLFEMTWVKRMHIRFAAVLTLCLAVPAAAQLSPPAVDVGAGGWVGTGGGVRDHRTGVVFDAMISGVALHVPHANLVVAVNASDAHAPSINNDGCLLATPPSHCAPDYPQFTAFGLLTGLEARSTQGSARALAGPAVFNVDGSGNAGGLQTRIDLASASVFHVSLVAAFRGTLVPRFRGDSYRTGSLSLGIRLR